MPEPYPPLASSALPERGLARVLELAPAVKAGLALESGLDLARAQESGLDLAPALAGPELAPAVEADRELAPALEVDQELAQAVEADQELALAVEALEAGLVLRRVIREMPWRWDMQPRVLPTV